MRTLLSAAATMAVFAGPTFANQSAYSDRDLDRCTILKQSGEGPSVSMKCTGYKDIPVYFREDDLRQSQTYGPVGQTYLDEVYETFGPFNHTGAGIEWRLDAGGRPFATIVRWFVADPQSAAEEKLRYGEVLVVSTVATDDHPASCVAGYVDALANRDANKLARTVADEEAHDFACGLDEPQWHGVRSTLAGEPMRHLPAAAR